MSATWVHNRSLALYLALSLLVMAPLESQAQYVGMGRQPSIGTVVGAVVLGGGVLFALKAMAGPASAVGAFGAAGTGFAGAVGRATGALMSGVSSLWSSLSAGASTLFASVGRMMGTGLSGISSVVTQPWFLVSAALIGGGLLAYHFYKKSHSAPDSSATLPQPTSFYSRFRQGMLWPGGMRPLRPLPYSAAYYGGMSNFYLGGAAPFVNRQLTYVSGFGSRAGAGADRPVSNALGETVLPSMDASQGGRAGLMPGAPSDSASLTGALAKAEARKTAAYERLIRAMHSQPAVSETDSGAPPIDPVGDAIRDYEDATQQLELLREKGPGAVSAK